MNAFLKVTVVAGFALACVLTFSCTGDIERIPRPVDDEEDTQSSSSVETGSSGSVNSSSSGTALGSSGSANSSSSNALGNSGGVVYGEPVDYQGETYPTVVIGKQTWFAKNLNYATEDSKCSQNQKVYCEKYGRLYTWATADTICPTGWHLPSREEWDALEAYIHFEESCSNCAINHLKATEGWNRNGSDKNYNGSDTYGFSALPGGNGTTKDEFYFLGGVSSHGSGYWWTSTVGSLGYTHVGIIISDDGSYINATQSNATTMYSVRCIKD